MAERWWSKRGRRTGAAALAVVLVASMAVVGWHPMPASAVTVTFTVDSTSDGVDADAGDGSCATADATCTLRAAIEESNAAPADAHTISFSVSGIIRPVTTFPSIASPTTIDGSSAPGASPGTQPVVGITCDDAPPVADGLRLDAPHSTIRSIRVDGCKTAITITAAAAHARVAGTWLNVDGISRGYPYGGQYGIAVDANDVLIGGLEVADRNVLDSQDNVIEATDSTADGISNALTVEGNWIGIRPNGGNIGDFSYGVQIHENVHALVGGTSPGAGNVISGGVSGVHFVDNGAGITIQGNLLGTDPTGTIAAGGNSGVSGDGAYNVPKAGTAVPLIGGSAPGAGNLMSGNSFTAVAAQTRMIIQGNLIGTDITGTAAIPNGKASPNYGAVTIRGEGNPYADGGVVVGGSAPGEGNVISGNLNAAISVDAKKFQILGNLIGTDATGTTALPNGGPGVAAVGYWVGAGQIGGVGPGEGNTIVNSPEQGVVLGRKENRELKGVTVRGNRIYANAGLTMDLNQHSPNFAANGDQLPPTITSITPSAGATEIAGTVTSDQAGPLLVDVYASDQCQAAWGTGEAKQYLGTISVPYAGSNVVTPFSGTVDASTVGSVITATTTQAVNGTSQFSNCGPVTDLQVTSRVNMDVASAESDLAVELRVTNAGPSPISDLVLPIDLPSDDITAVGYPTFDPPSQGTITGTNNLWSIGSLAPGASAAVCVRGEVTRTYYTYDWEGITRYAHTYFNPGISTTSVHAVDPYRGNDQTSVDPYITPDPYDPPLAAIRDVCSPPDLSVDDASLTRPTSGTAPMTFTVHLSAPATRTVTVHYDTVKALAVPVEDFVATSGDVVIPVGETTGTISVPIVGNQSDEPAKSFRVVLSAPLHAQLAAADATATGTIEPNHALAGCPSGSSKDQRFICHLYADALGRPPDAGGLAHWVAKLTGGTTRTTAARAFLSEPEGLRKAADRAYVLYLGRHGTTAELKAWADKYKAKTATTQDTRIAVLASPEYFTKVGGTPTSFVERLYTDVFRRPADPAGVTYWTHRLAIGDSRAKVATRFISEPEGRRKIIGDLYLRFLRRDATSAETTAALKLLAAGRSEVDIVVTIAGGTEYYNRPSS